MNKQSLLKSLEHQGFSDKILNAFSKIKREDFIDKNLKQYTYEDEPLPIGQGQTISQPYTIAFMLNLLELPESNNKTNNIQKLRIDERDLNPKRGTNKKILDKNNIKILEIGSGSGYVLALINNISKNSQIFGIERIKELADKSKQVLKNYKNIKIICADGSKGLKPQALFDRILISASANEIPQKLISQLKFGGIMVCPVKNSIFQIKRELKETKLKEYPGFVFVPLIKDKI